MESLFNHSSNVCTKNSAWRKVALFVLTLGILVGTSACGLPFMQTSTPFPTLFVPTPDCGPSILVIGSSPFEIQTLQLAPDGSLAVPPDTSGIAYWVEGTVTHHVFVLSPVPENLALLSMITAESAAKVTWKNCNSATYSLATPQQSSLNASASADQSVQGITVFFQTDSSGAGVVVKGELTEEQISTFNTPASDASEVQVEIGLLETIPSEDGTTVRIGVSIYNWGQSALTLSGDDVSLTQPDATPLTLVSSEPPLPKEIAPAATETFYFAFPRPSAQVVTLKIFTVEYDIEGF